MVRGEGSGRGALHRLGLADVAARMASGALPCMELTRACLARIAKREPALRAFAWIDPERALAAAAAADRARELGGALGPLHGLPLGLKDVVPTRGIPTEYGSVVFRGFVPDASAEIVQRLETAGAFVLGKTITAELAFLTPGPTCNPWNAAHTPGGSSSGSAAAVAAGFCPGALGTQTNGSVIRPAAFCGVVGFKPSRGTLPFQGISHFSPSLDQLGVFARSVTDAAFLVAGLARPDVPVEAAPALTGPTPRLLALHTPVWDRISAAQRSRFERDVAALRHAGARVEEVPLPPLFDEAHRVQRTIMFREGADTLSGLVREHGALLSPGLRSALDEGRAVSDDALADARATRCALEDALDAVLAQVDAVVTPPAPGEAPVGLSSTGDPAFCTIWTLAGTPALTIPTGLGSGGLPLGLQIVSRRGRDDLAVASAAFCERALPPPDLPG